MTDLRTAAQQALEALEYLDVTAEHWVDDRIPDAAITALRAALEQTEQTNPWRDAVDDELVSLHMVASDDPRESIRRLIDWHCAVQIDPLVSSAAQELIERALEAALEKPKFTLSCGCPSQYGGVPAYWDRDGGTAFGMICERHWNEYGARSNA
jgi:hypothetical protein